MQSFYWDNNIVSVKMSSLQQTVVSGQPTVFQIQNRYKIDQYTSVLLYSDDFNNYTLLTQASGHQSQYNITSNLKNLRSGHYRIKINISSNDNIVFEFPFNLENNNPRTVENAPLQTIITNTTSPIIYVQNIGTKIFYNVNINTNLLSIGGNYEKLSLNIQFSNQGMVEIIS